MKKIFENFLFKFLMTLIVKVIGGFSCTGKNYCKLNDNEIAKLSIAYALDYLQVKHGCEKQGPWTFNEENEMLVTIRNYIDNNIETEKV